MLPRKGCNFFRAQCRNCWRDCRYRAFLTSFIALPSFIEHQSHFSYRTTADTPSIASHRAFLTFVMTVSLLLSSCAFLQPLNFLYRGCLSTIPRYELGMAPVRGTLWMCSVHTGIAADYPTCLLHDQNKPCGRRGSVCDQEYMQSTYLLLGLLICHLGVTAAQRHPSPSSSVSPPRSSHLASASASPVYFLSSPSSPARYLDFVPPSASPSLPTQYVIAGYTALSGLVRVSWSPRAGTARSTMLIVRQRAVERPWGAGRREAPVE